MVRVYKEGNLVMFITGASGTFEGGGFPNNIIRIRFLENRIQFVNAQTDIMLRDVRKRDMDYPFGEVRKEDGTPYGTTIIETVSALALVINFNSVSGGGGSTDLTPVYEILAQKAPYAYVNEGITAVKGAPLITLNTLEKLGQAIGNDATFAQTVASSLAGKATHADISTAVANLLNNAPETLDTLEELAAALGEDPNFATTILNAVGLRELLSNKVTNFLMVDDIKYPTTRAVYTLLLDYVTSGSLNNVLANYVANSALTTALAGKANTAHNHAIGDISDRIQARVILNAPSITNVLVSNTFTKIAGTTTATMLLNATAPQDNRLVVGVAGAVRAMLVGNFTGSNNVTYTFAIAKNGAMVASAQIRVTSGGQPFLFVVADLIQATAGDFFEGFVACTNANADPNIIDMKLLFM